MHVDNDGCLAVLGLDYADRLLQVACVVVNWMRHQGTIYVLILEAASGCNQGDVFVRSSQEFGSPGLFLIWADTDILETPLNIFDCFFNA